MALTASPVRFFRFPIKAYPGHASLARDGTLCCSDKTGGPAGVNTCNQHKELCPMCRFNLAAREAKRTGTADISRHVVTPANVKT